MSELTGARKCPVCGKTFIVLYPHQWAYRRDKSKTTYHYFCSWGCLRAWDDKKGQSGMNLTKDQKKRVIEIALTGENPSNYIESCGINNPHCTWWNIKKNLQKNDPATYAKLPEKFKARGRKAVETPEDVVHGPVTPEEFVTITKFEKFPEVTEPPKKTIMLIRAVEGEFGVYHYKPKNGYLDYESHDYSGIVSMTVNDWRKFLKELHDAAGKLGVEL